MFSSQRQQLGASAAACDREIRVLNDTHCRSSAHSRRCSDGMGDVLARVVHISDRCNPHG